MTLVRPDEGLLRPGATSPFARIPKALAKCAGIFAEAFRWKLKHELVLHRFRRLDRLLEAGRRREARRTLAAVKRDCAVWFRTPEPGRYASPGPPLGASGD